MRERGILFSGEMVRAILAGRKTQTRRPLKPQPFVHFGEYGPEDLEWKGARGLTPNALIDSCPYGGRLWVRETWQIVDEADADVSGRLGPAAPYKGVQGTRSITWRAIYRADGDLPDHPVYGRALWRSPIYQPRWASRLALEVTAVRVERLQDISEEDAKAEAAPCLCDQCGNDPEHDGGEAIHWACDDDSIAGHRVGFAVLWDRLNAKRGYGWEANPWVWVVAFEVIK